MTRSQASLRFAVALSLLGSVTAQARFVELPITDESDQLPRGTAVAAGDFDGDGIDDVVIGSIGRNRLFLGDGRGGYVEAAANRMPNRSARGVYVAPELIHAVDVDGDGDLDLVERVVVVGSSGCVGGGGSGPALAINDGAGTFTDASTRLVVPAARRFESTTCIASGDIDGDGDPDLVLGRRTRAFDGTNDYVPVQDLLLVNDGAGRFLDASASLPMRREVTQALVLVDVDGDQDLDLVSGFAPGRNQPAGSSLSLNDGAGTFTEDLSGRLPSGGQGAVFAADLDGDGDGDLLFGQSVGNRGLLFANDGTGRFIDVTQGNLPDVSVPFLQSRTWDGIASTDLDADGDTDLVFGRKLLRNGGAGGFSQVDFPAGGEGSVVFADCDRDGLDDLVFQNGFRCLNGGGFFAATQLTSLPSRTGFGLDVAVGDLNGDGALDVVVADQLFRALVQDGYGSFRDVRGLDRLVGEDGVDSIELGDVDGDGDLDVVASIRSFDRLFLFLNDGQASFVEVTYSRMPLLAGSWAADFALGDVDGDGDLDLVTASSAAGQNTGQNQLLLNDGLGRFSVAANRMPTRNDNSFAVEMVDVDADRDLDLVFANSGRDRLYLNDGRGRFADFLSPVLPADQSGEGDVAVFDANRDGALDMFFGRDLGNRLFLGNGRGGFLDVTSRSLPSGFPAARSVEVGDLDDDGDIDLVLRVGNVCHSGTGTEDVRVLVNDGGGGFSVPTQPYLDPAQDPGIGSIALFDCDGDGDLDLYTATFQRWCGGSCGGSTPMRDRLFVNRDRQLRTPVLPRLGGIYPLEIHAIADAPTTQLFAQPYLSTGQSATPLPGLGTLRLDPQVLVPLPVVAVPQRANVVTTTLAVPNDAALVGAEIFAQSLLLGWSDRTRLTNAVRDRILR